VAQNREARKRGAPPWGDPGGVSSNSPGEYTDRASLRRLVQIALTFFTALDRALAEPHDLVDASEVLKDIHRDRATLRLWIKGRRFPAEIPRRSPKGRRQWRRADIELWKAGKWKPPPKKSRN